jgi:hypothetical protein
MIHILSKESLAREAQRGFVPFEKYIKNLEVFSSIDPICSGKIEQYLLTDNEGKIQIWKEILSWVN